MSTAHSTSHVNALRLFADRGVVAWDGKQYAGISPRGVHQFVVDPREGNDVQALKGVGSWKTIQSCHDNAVVSGRGDHILILSNYLEGGVLAGFTTNPFRESVTISKDNVALIGVSAAARWPEFTSWKSAVDGEICLTITGCAVSVINLHFQPKAGGTGIKVDCQEALAAKCVCIVNCRFAGSGAGIGIEVCGGDNLLIEGCHFEYLTNAGAAYAIKQGSSGFQFPQRMKIFDNIFHKNDNHIGLDCCISLIRGNVIDGGGTVNLNVSLNGSGGENIVMSNFLGGDYSIAGGYKASANDHSWIGNIAPDTAEAEVEAGGRTIGDPA